ncbi:MAG: ClpXP protease specificity-enhancing factor [Granulosicoccus sp.]|nr:ClpXP protease specificity-enhancing factor [Granulosicoccus sp.]
MTSSRPYLIRALYEWIVDNQFTPYMLVDATSEEVVVPRTFVEGGRIILNISPDATHSLMLGNDFIAFNARFSGAAMDVSVPVASVLAVYARENGQGMMFEDPDDTPSDPTDPTEPPQAGDGDSTGSPSDEPKKPVLKIVK